MKITPDHPALTAYALGELSEPESTAVARALQKDPALAKECEAISGLAGLLGEALGGDRLSLGADRHQEIFQSARRADAGVLVLDHQRRSRRQSLLTVAGVAVVVVAGFLGLSKMNVKSPGGAPSGSDVAGSGISGGSANTGPGEVTPAVNPTVSLPLNVGMAVPAMIAESLSREGTLPSADQFDIAAWVNLTRLTSDPKVIIGNVGVYSEVGSCPWNPDRDLLLVNLNARTGSTIALDARLNLNPSRVKSALLVGGDGSANFAPVEGGELQGSKSWLYELELIPGDEELGSINVEVTGEGDAPQSGYLPLGSDPLLNRAVSSDFEVARTLAAFARWGADEKREREELSEVARNARNLLTKVENEQVRFALDAILLAEESFGE